MSSFKERINSKVATLKENAIEAGKVKARQDIEDFEKGAFEVYKRLGTDEFTVDLIFTNKGEFKMCFLYDGIDYARHHAEKHMKTPYEGLSKLEQNFFQAGYQAAWEEEGFGNSPLWWYSRKFAELIR